MSLKYRSKHVIPILFFLFYFIFNTASYSQITPPEKYLGYKPGADFKLATYENLIGYLELIASQTDRMQIFDMGLTTEGRRMKYAIISSAENMAKLEHYKEISRKLSLARGISEEEAKQLASDGKVVVWIDSGIHASETSPQMHQFQLTYNLVTRNDKKTKFILDNVILLLVHANPDGMTIVANWYQKNVGTKFETSSLPVLYNKYAGHDNNRDSFMANLNETQNMNRVVGTEWFPELLYVQHETAPFPARIWIPPNPEPVNPNIHPIVERWKNLIGAAMGQGFDGENKPGAISRTAFDLWYPGYADGPSVESHNIPSILTETANYRYATPRYYTINDFPEAYRDLTVGTFYPSPWEGGWWRFQDAVNYNLTASMSVLDVAAKYRFEFLNYKYKMAKDVIEQFKKEPPYGWIIPANQRDQNIRALLLERLKNYGIEIYTADEDFIQDGIKYSKGDFIIPTSQPFGLFVKNLFEKQSYPDLRKYGHLWQGISRSMKWDGAPLAPYDGVGWTLPIQMGIETREMGTPFKVKTNLMNEVIYPSGKLNGGGSYFVLSPTENNSYSTVNQVLKAGGKVNRAIEDFSLNGKKYSKITFIVDNGSLKKNILSEIISETGITMSGGKVKVKSKPLTIPRIALYKSWVANMDAGWISYVFDQYDFSYHLLTDAEIKAGNLKNRFDVIILPDQRTRSIINGHRKGTMPPNYVGGISTAGVENIKRFVEDGGTLICNKSSSDFAIEQFNLPIHNVLQDIKSDSFNCPGSLIKVNYDLNHPISYGMPKKGMGYFSRGLVFETKQDTLQSKEKSVNKPVVIASFPNESPLISGWMIGEELIKNKAAIMEVGYGKGKIILFGFNVVNRAQAYSTFKLLFNAIYN